MPSWSRARAYAPLILLLPVLTALDRPVMIDDTLFLKAATQILRDPLRPYDFIVNWYGWPELFWDVFKNPPVEAYWLAAARLLGARTEIALHLAVLPFALLAVLGGVRLARRFVDDSAWATAVWVASPAFLVATATLMADVAALACSVWGLALWIEGTDRDLQRLRRLGALLAGMAVIVKYTAILGVAGVMLYSLLGRERGRRLDDLWVASLPAFGWGLLTLGTMERVHMVDALVVAGGGFTPNPGWFGHRPVATLTFVAGTGVAVALLAIASLRTRRDVPFVAGALVAGTIAALIAPSVWSPRAVASGARIMVGILSAAGALVLAQAAREATRDRDGRFLALWAALHVAYLCLWSWTVASRFVLPLLVPVALLLVRAVARERPVLARRVVVGAIIVSSLVGMAVLRADSFPGELYRRALPDIASQARAEGRRAYFVGAWGFQYYAERLGFERLDTRSPVRPGDLIVQPYYAANNRLPFTVANRVRQGADIPAPAPPFDLHTMNLNVGAGFHASAFGPLPYVRAHLPAEGIKVWLVTP